MSFADRQRTRNLKSRIAYDTNYSMAAAAEPEHDHIAEERARRLREKERLAALREGGGVK